MVDVKNVNGNRKRRNKNSKNRNKAVRLVAILMCIVLVMTALPLTALASYDDVIETWTSGDTTCTLTEGNEYLHSNSGYTLTISGNGAMADYTLDELPPWESYYGAGGTTGGAVLRDVVVEDGVTSIGNYAFYNAASVMYLELPDTLTSIGDYAFYNCFGETMGSVTLPDSISYIGEKGVYGCSDICFIYANCYNSYLKDYFETTDTNACIYEAQHDSTKKYTVNENATDAVCTEGGTYDEVTYCSDCGTKLSSKTVTVDATGHDFVHYDAVEPTCTEDGNIEYWKCSVCGKYFLSDDDIYSTDYADYDKDIVIKATGSHTWDDGEITTPATCTTDGVMTYTCTECGETKTEAIPATGHVKGDGVTENYYWEDGMDYYDWVYYCTVCGEEISREQCSGLNFHNMDLSGLNILSDLAIILNGEIVPAIDVETHDSWTSDACTLTFNEETIVTLGTVLYACIIQRGDSDLDFSTSLSLDNVFYQYIVQVILDQGYFDMPFTFYTRDGDDWHNALSMTITATYDEDADSISYDYEILNSDFADGATQDISLADLWMVFDFSCPHNYELTDTKDATCTEDGYNTYTCAWCGDEYTDTITATGHVYDEDNYVIENEIEATKKTDGSYDEVWYCDVCGEEVKRETVTVSATGYTFDINLIIDGETINMTHSTGHNFCGFDFEENSSENTFDEYLMIAEKFHQQGLYFQSVTFSCADEDSWLNNAEITFMFSADENGYTIDYVTEGFEYGMYYVYADCEVDFYLTTTCPHQYKLIDSKEATANEDGYNTYHCYICGDEYTEIIPAGTGFCTLTINYVSTGLDANGEELYEQKGWSADNLNESVSYSYPINSEYDATDLIEYDMTVFDENYGYVFNSIEGDLTGIITEDTDIYVGFDPVYIRQYCALVDKDTGEVIYSQPFWDTGYNIGVNVGSTSFITGFALDASWQGVNAFDNEEDLLEYVYDGSLEPMGESATEMTGKCYRSTGSGYWTSDSSMLLNDLSINVNYDDDGNYTLSTNIFDDDYSNVRVYYNGNQYSPSGIQHTFSESGYVYEDTINPDNLDGTELEMCYIFYVEQNHTWDDGTITTPATCTTDGVMTYTCTECGETKTEVIPATGHVAGDAVKENVVEATKTTAGSYDNVVYCEVCGAELERYTVETNALGVTARYLYYLDGGLVDYSYDSTHEMNFSQDVLDGLLEFAQTAYEDYGYYFLGVDFECDDADNALNGASCTLNWSADADNSTSIEVILDGADIDDEIDATDDWSLIFNFSSTCPHQYYLIDSQESTCTVQGHNTYHCYICGDEYTDILPLTEHTEGDTVQENYTVSDWGRVTYDLVTYCTVCGTELSRTSYSEYNGETLDNNKYIFVINMYLDGELIYSDSNTKGGNYTIDLDYYDGNLGALQPVADGYYYEGYYLYKVDWNCADENSYFNDIELEVTYIPTEDGGYTLKYETINAPDGVTNIVTTSDIAINYYLTTQCSHNYELTETKEATCTEEGYNRYTCTWCGDTYDDSIAKTDHVAGSVVIENELSATCTSKGSYDEVTYCENCGTELSRTTITTDALGHTEGEVQIENVVEPTCTSDGSHDEVIYCTVCGAELSRVTITDSATGHHYTDIVVDPTDDEMGYTEHVCEDCGDYYRDNYTDALGHDYELVETVEPTCTEDGYNKYQCKTCDASYTETLPATGHTAGNPVKENEIEATCITDGSYDEVVYCEVCGTELSRTSCMINATGHTVVTDDAVAATCTETGLTAGTHCSVCGEILTAQETIPATGHDYQLDNNRSFDATCTIDGQNVYVCQNGCGSEYTETIPATGHTYTSAVTREATCTEEGIITYTCVNGDDTYTEFIPMIAHTEGTAVKENVVEATAEHDGSYDLVVYCTVCGTELSRETITVPYENTHEGETPTLNEGTYVPATDDTEGSYEVTYDDGTTEERTIPEGNTDDPIVHDDTFVAPTDDEDGSVIVTMPDGKDVVVVIPSGTEPEYKQDDDGNWYEEYPTDIGDVDIEIPVLTPDTYVPATDDTDGEYNVEYQDGTDEDRTIDAGNTDDPIVHDDTFVEPTDDTDGSVIVTMPDGKDAVVEIPAGTEPEYKQDDDGNWYEEYPTDIGGVDIDIPTLEDDTFTPATDNTDGSYTVTYPDGTTEGRVIDAGDTDDPIVHDDTFVEPTDDTDGSVIVTMPDGKDVVVEIPAGTEPEYKQDDDGNWYEEYPSDIGPIDIPTDEPENNNGENDTDELPIYVPDTYEPADENNDGSYTVTNPDGTEEEHTIPEGTEKDPEIHDDTVVEPTDDTDGSVIVTMPDDEDVIVEIPSGTIPDYVPDTYIPATEDEDGSYTVTYPTDVGDVTVEHTIPAGTDEEPTVNDDTLVPPTDDEDGSVIVTMPDGEDVKVTIPSGTEPEYKQDDDGNWYEEYPTDLGDLDVEIPTYNPDTFTPATDDTDGSYTVTYPDGTTEERVIDAGDTDDPIAHSETLTEPTDDTDGSVIVTMPDGKDVVVVIPAGTEPEYKQDDDGNWVEVYPSDIGDIEIEIPVLTPDTYTPSTDDSEGSYNVTYKDGTDEDRTIEAGNDKEIEVHTDTFVAPTDDTDGSVIVTMPDDKDVMVVIPSGTEGTYNVDDDGNTVIVYPTDVGDIEIPVDLPTYTPDTFVPATETEDGSYTVVLPDGTVEERTIPAGNTDDPIIHDETFVEPTEDTNGSVVVTMPDGEDVIVEIPAGTIPDYVESTYVPATDDTDGSYDVVYHTDVGDIRITITIPAGTEGEPTFDMDSFVAPTDTEDGYVYVTMPDGKVVKYVIAAGTEGTLTQLDDGSWVTVYSTDFGDLNVPSDYTDDVDSDSDSEETANSTEIVETNNDNDITSDDEDNTESVQALDTGANNHIVIIIIIVIILLACIIILAVVNKKNKTKKK